MNIDLLTLTEFLMHTTRRIVKRVMPMYAEQINDAEGEGLLLWIRLPRIPISIEDAKSMTEGGNIVFICEVVVVRGRNTLLRLSRMIKDANKDLHISVWHNKKRNRMITRRVR